MGLWERARFLVTDNQRRERSGAEKVGGEQPRGPAWEQRLWGEKVLLPADPREEVAMEVARRCTADTKFSVSGQEPLIWARPHSLGGALTEIPREPSRSA